MADEDALVEALAALAHEQWSGWLRYQFTRGTLAPNGNMVLPAEWVERWQKQMDTSYAGLKERDKESDRKEARHVLAALASERERAAQAVRTRIYIILAGVLDSLDQAEHLTDRIMGLVAGKEEA